MKRIILILSLATMALSAHAGRRDNIVSHYPTPRYAAPDTNNEESNPIYFWLRHGFNMVTGCCAGNDVIFSTKPKEGTPR